MVLISFCALCRIKKGLLLVSSSSGSRHFLSCARIFCSPTSGPAAGPRHPHGIFFPLSGCKPPSQGAPKPDETLVILCSQEPSTAEGHFGRRVR